MICNDTLNFHGGADCSTTRAGSWRDAVQLDRVSPTDKLQGPVRESGLIQFLKSSWLKNECLKPTDFGSILGWHCFMVM